MLFEKADVIAANGNGTCAVAYCDGSVKRVQVKGKTNREIAEELVAGSNAPGNRKKTVIANASEE